jgi:outer membrane receptor protein involved in Fe transport
MRTNTYSTAIGVTAGILCFLLSPAAAGATSGEEPNLFDLSITELMDIEIDVPATITEKNPLKTPASVTVITADDIAITPARNIMDLLEIYVPGAIYMNHSVGPLPGIRGVLVDRPYKYLVNVNGVNVNIKAHYGARLELLNWDLSDIARIEIIRGPGSVTYGPGAIGGVINIYTKSAKQAEGLQVGGKYWGKYNSFGNHISYGHDGNDTDVYGFLSVVHTDGTTPDLFGVSSATKSGYVGTPGGPGSPRPPADYMTDYDDEPQIKAHADVRLGEHWRLWTRYVTSSSELMQGSAVKYFYEGDYENFRQTRYRYIQLALENRAPLDDMFELRSLYGVSSIDVHNIEKFDTASGAVNDRDSLQNIGWIWSENEYFARWMLHYRPDTGGIKAAAGAEISYDTIGPAWGKNEDDGLRLASGIISGPSSEAYGTGFQQVNESSTTYFPVGEGWETWTNSLLGELNVEVTPKLTGLLSARLDKHSYTNAMFSPRGALIYELETDHYLKLIGQRSVRMNTQEELYMNHVLGEDNDPEELTTVEGIYSGRLTERLSFQSSLFYNWNDVIAWDWAQRRATPVGKLQTAGVELEAGYHGDSFNVGINHAFTKQIDWDLDDDLLVSGISYSDYYQDAGSGVIITSNGNDLNNWSNNVTKLFANWQLLGGKLTLHGDMRVLWGFEGAEDGLDALAEAGGSPGAIDDARRRGAYDAEVSAGLSLAWHVSPAATLTVFAQNIPVVGDNKRYSYSSGFKKVYPDKVSWIEEPTVVGVAWEMRF